MKKLLKKITNLFRLKSPCCNSKMENVGEHSGSLVYVCIKCLKAWF
jgi:hypothetical protein